MKIIKGERPPNFEKIRKVFPSATQRGVIFTFGHKIYVPSGEDIPESLIAHETIHAKRQGRFSRTIESWWDEYLSDKNFRFSEELLAHRKEFEWFKNSTRDERLFALGYISRRLSSPLYGNMITYKKAKAMIKRREK